MTTFDQNLIEPAPRGALLDPLNMFLEAISKIDGTGLFNPFTACFERIRSVIRPSKKRKMASASNNKRSIRQRPSQALDAGNCGAFVGALTNNSTHPPTRKNIPPNSFLYSSVSRTS